MKIQYDPREETCPYLSSEEDHWRTTSYPVCTCNMKQCEDYPYFCPIRDD